LKIIFENETTANIAPFSDLSPFRCFTGLPMVICSL